MYIIKNAFVSIIRNKGRNFLIGIIILVISAATAVTLAIKNSASDLIDAYADSVDLIASITFDRQAAMSGVDLSDDDSRESMRENFNSASSLTVDEIDSYGNSDYVTDYYYTMTVGVDADDLEAASSDFGNNDSSKGAPSGTSDKMMGGGKGFQMGTSTDFSLTGYSSLSAMTNFVNGTYTITDGSVFDDFESSDCIVNSELAELNELSVGDKITVTDPESDDDYELTIVGIYSDNESDSTGMSLFSNSVNTIITNAFFVNSMVTEDEDLSVNVTPSFVLNNSDNIEAFTDEVKEKGLAESLTVTTNEDEVANSTSTISNVASFATTFLVLTLIIGGIVLFVINMINIRERKYEIGVLRTIGMKKVTLTIQFALELLIVAIASLVIGAGIGAVCSVPVSNSLLQSEISSSNTTQETIQNNFGGKNFGGGAPTGGATTVQVYDSIDATVDVKVLVELMLIGIGLTFVSSLASMISIQKFSPLTILKERS